MDEKITLTQLRNVTIGAICTIIFLTLILMSVVRGEEAPDELWKAVIAEDTSGNYEDYLVIVSVVRNRLNKGMDYGLVAYNRKDLDSFVKRECLYAQRVLGIDLKATVMKAITAVFYTGTDYAFGATHYEHTGVYPTPKYYRDMEIVAILHQGTPRELTLAR